MVGIATLKAYEVKTLEDWFNLILDSQTNGQRKQAVDYFSKLSSEQKRELREYLVSNYSAEKYLDLIEYLGY